MVKDFQLRFFSSIFLFIPLFLLFLKSNFIFLFIIQLLLSLSLWEFFRLKSFKDYLKKQKKINSLLSRHKISSLDFIIIFKVNLVLLTFYFSNAILLFILLIVFFLHSYLILKLDFVSLLPFFVFFICFWSSSSILFVRCAGTAVTFVAFASSRSFCTFALFLFRCFLDAMFDRLVLNSFLFVLSHIIICSLFSINCPPTLQYDILHIHV